MRWSETSEQYCSVARTLGQIGERWTLLVIREAFDGVRRFEDFQQRLDIARNILTDRLQRLVEAGILDKRKYQDKPPRYEYRLTDSGRDLYPILVSLMTWGDKWLGGKRGAPISIVHTPCGHTVVPALVCPDCGQAMHARNTELVPGPGLPKAAAEERERERERLRGLYRNEGQ